MGNKIITYTEKSRVTTWELIYRQLSNHEMLRLICRKIILKSET